MKGSFGTYLDKLRSRFLPVVVAVLAGITAVSCSDVTRTPPDDDEGSVREKASCHMLNENPDQSAAFLACAAELVQAEQLSDVDRFALSSCNFESAQPQDAPSEQFESVRSLIREICL